LRKNRIIYYYKDFISFFKEHIKKKSHNSANEILMIALSPLKKLMEINNRLLIFENNMKDRYELESNYFTYKAMIEEFANCY